MWDSIINLTALKKQIYQKKKEKRTLLKLIMEFYKN
jgi:hypothetical protein